MLISHYNNIIYVQRIIQIYNNNIIPIIINILY